MQSQSTKPKEASFPWRRTTCLVQPRDLRPRQHDAVLFGCCPERRLAVTARHDGTVLESGQVLGFSRRYDAGLNCLDARLSRTNAAMAGSRFYGGPMAHDM
jgi:hypothetical protein